MADTEIITTYLYVIADVKANIYSPPVTFQSSEAFQQYLSVLVNTHGNGHYHLYPEDYVAYCIGEYDDETGTIFQYPEKKFECALVGLKKECAICKQQEDFNNESVKVQQGSAGKDAAQ